MAKSNHPYEVGSNQHKKVPKANPYASGESRGKARRARNGIHSMGSDDAIESFSNANANDNYDNYDNYGNSGGFDARSMSAVRTFGEAGEHLAGKAVPSVQQFGSQKWEVVTTPATLETATRAANEFSFVNVPFRNDTLSLAFAGVH